MCAAQQLPYAQGGDHRSHCLLPAYTETSLSLSPTRPTGDGHVAILRTSIVTRAQDGTCYKLPRLHLAA